MRKRLVVTASYYALHLLPAAVVVSADWPYAAWMTSCVLAATAVRWLWQMPKVVWRTLALLINALTALANILLMISLRLQGVGFNDQFFFHVDWHTLTVGMVVFWPLFFGCCALWLLTSAWPLLLPREGGAPPGSRNPRRRLPVALGLAAVGIAANAPVLSLGWFVAADLMAWRQALLVPKPAWSAQRAQIEAPTELPNLIFIYAEALETTFSNPEVFGYDVTPRLAVLAEQGLRFTDMHQVSSTGWTTGALVAAQCALPMARQAHRESLTQRFTFDASMAGATCLGDVLAAAGYRTVFMGGAPLAFAGKGSFLAAHGFHERHGLTTLKPKLENPAYASPWGLHDDSLLALAEQRLTELDAAEEPFVLALLTLDTHSPAGWPSASCGKPEAEDDALFAVRCTDRLIANFIDTVRKDYADAFVALFSDHLIPFDNVLAQPLRAFQSDRRLRFVLWAPGIVPGTVEKPGTHFDVAPTLLDQLGFQGWTEHNLGASLLRLDSPWFRYERPYSLRIVHDLPDLRLLPGDTLTFDPDGPLIATEDMEMLATSTGLRLNDAVFAIALDGDGHAQAIGNFRQPHLSEAFSNWAADRAVIGVSSDERFNRGVLKAEATLAYFAGVLGGPEFVTGVLSRQITFAMPGI